MVHLQLLHDLLRTGSRCDDWLCLSAVIVLKYEDRFLVQQVFCASHRHLFLIQPYFFGGSLFVRRTKTALSETGTLLG